VACLLRAKASKSHMLHYRDVGRPIGLLVSWWYRRAWDDGGRWEADVSEPHRITVNPEQNGGRPSIRGLRVRVKDVPELLAAGVSREEILADYPYLEDGDITAALEYAAQQSDHPVLRAH
jgi:uncharacterized protein (DUF433 family)